MNRPFCVATWNVNGIRARQAQLAEWVTRERPDVICLQEIKAAPEQVPVLLLGLADYQCLWHGAGAYSGVALCFLRERFPDGGAGFFHPPFDHDSRIACATREGITFASVYVPNGGRDGRDLPAKLDFLGALAAFVEAEHAAGRAVVTSGDLNVAHTARDVHEKERPGPGKPDLVGQSPVERARFDALLATGLVDVARRLRPDADDLFTWWAPWRQRRERNIGWRIDYVLASAALAERAVDCRVEREVPGSSATGAKAQPTSDHGAVLVRFG